MPPHLIREMSSQAPLVETGHHFGDRRASSAWAPHVNTWFVGPKGGLFADPMGPPISGTQTPGSAQTGGGTWSRRAYGEEGSRRIRRR